MTLRLSLILIAVVTLFRVVLLQFDRTDLFVDEAQYWLWAQSLDFGYYSKPPMIAWVIHLFTFLAGSQEIVWIRLASPLLHMATALLLIPAASRLTGSREIGAWTGVTYVTLPAVALSSVFLSTDTVLFPFLALALLAYSHLIERASIVHALLLGVAIGLGTLSKYAMLFFAVTTLLAAIVLPRARIGLRDCAIAALVAVIVIAPNLWWNATHGGATFRHTSENASWTGVHFRIGEAAKFLVSQFGVIGPVLFSALLYGLFRVLRGRAGPLEKHLTLLAWPIILAIVFQALMSRAYANWAATAYGAGTMLAVLILLAASPKALKVSLIINGLATVVFPLMTVYAEQVVTPKGKPILNRYLGRADLSRTIAATAARSGTATIVADNRDILADLFYTLRDAPFTIRARTTGGYPRNFYEQTYPLTAATGADTVLYVTAGNVTCHGVLVDPVADLSPTSGYLAGRKLRAYAVPAACLTNQLT